MIEATFHIALCWVLIGTGVLTIVIVSFVTAPYGRHYRGCGWGPEISCRLGWFIMEAPALLVFILVFSKAGMPII